VKSAFVTGAGSGIGRATALRLAQGGAAVGAFDRDEGGVEAVVEEVKASGGQAIGVVGDVTDGEALAAAVARTVAELGGLDATAACAGVEVTGTVESMSQADWDRALAVNLTGVMLTARHAVPAMVADRGGAFVAISSDLGIQGAADWTPYAVSKHGVVGLVRCLALDYGPQGVRSNVVCPSFVKTPMAERILNGAGAEEQAAWERLLPLGRIASPDEIAAVIYHLLSRESSYSNGMVYPVDGGETAGLYLGSEDEGG
jgi:meso-butanediol dehydrogenase / (S,S)-butanediol dehydrogenase / diacetyl reductase